MTPSRSRSRDRPPTDSADVPWAGRDLGPGRAEDDTGAADPVLRALLADARTDDSTLMSALGAARLVVPVVAEPAAVDESGTHVVDTQVDLAAVTLLAPDGQRALPVFTGTDALSAWEPGARPVPVTSARAGQAAVAERCDVVVVDVAGPSPRVLRPSMVWALAQQRAWLPPHTDPFVERGVRGATADEDDVLSVTVEEGRPLGEGVLGVVLHLRPGLVPEHVRAVATRVGERLAADGELRARVDGLAFRIT